MNEITVPIDSVLVSLMVKQDQQIIAGQTLAIVEAMKMHYPINADHHGVISEIYVNEGDLLTAGDAIFKVIAKQINQLAKEKQHVGKAKNSELDLFQQRIAKTYDEARTTARDKRHKHGYRTARENLNDLIDEGSFNEYGQLAVAAQRSRKTPEELQTQTAADGIITGTATINSELVGSDASHAAVVINDYSVLAGTQGYFHHHKLDRILGIAKQQSLPVVMYTEGGGGRPGDTDVLVSMAGLNVPSFKTWAGLSGQVPRIAVNNGYCFAGNAALFGCADITIATKTSNIGMAGPAMIEGGGLGKFSANEIGPAVRQSKNGVIDILAEDESQATNLAQQAISYFQGPTLNWSVAPQDKLQELIPNERQQAYLIRDVLKLVADTSSLLELQADYGQSIVTAFARIEGKPLGFIANNCHFNGGAVDAIAAEKAAKFIRLCDSFSIPLVSFTDTPGFMVGPESEDQAAVRKMSDLFVSAATISVPIVTIILRRSYGLGAMAMAGGSMFASIYTVSWPSGEFGAMGLEGAVRLGYKKELENTKQGPERDALFQQLLDKMIEQGRAMEAASYLEIDAVIDPSDTRTIILRALKTTPPS